MAMDILRLNIVGFNLLLAVIVLFSWAAWHAFQPPKATPQNPAEPQSTREALRILMQDAHTRRIAGLGFVIAALVALYTLSGLAIGAMRRTMERDGIDATWLLEADALVLRLYALIAGTILSIGYFTLGSRPWLWSGLAALGALVVYYYPEPFVTLARLAYRLLPHPS